jgi:hypothetical protein
MIMRIQIEVELDIFSGMPNPVWILTNYQADIFMKDLFALSPVAETKLSGNLGYRGFIVTVAEEHSRQMIRIQNGVVQKEKNEMWLYAADSKRKLERWLLNTGKPHIKAELFQMVEATF